MLQWAGENMWAVWIGVFLILAVLEILTLDLFFIMLAAGALAGLSTDLLGGSVPAQVVAACLVALLMVLMVRPFAIKHLRASPEDQRTNIDALVGAEAHTVLPVDQRGGQVKLAGEIWSARTLGPTPIPTGKPVVVVRIEGATAFVATGADIGPHDLPR